METPSEPCDWLLVSQQQSSQVGGHFHGTQPGPYERSWLDNVAKREEALTTALLFKVGRQALEQYLEPSDEFRPSELDESRRRTLAQEMLGSVESLQQQGV